MRPNLQKVNDLFKPNAKGFSQWVSVDDVIKFGLSWSNNGNARRGVAFNVNEFLWEFKRVTENPKSKVISLRLAGHNHSRKLNQAIRKDIKDALLKQTTSNFAPNCIVPLAKDDKEIDHRWGRKDSPKYHYINDLSKQSISDFQLLSHSHNQFKRQRCVECKEKNLRYLPPNNQEFKVGCKKWEDSVGCEGCPLAQPELYFS
jgi:hypothetical protein